MTVSIFDSLTHPTIQGNWLNSKYSGKTMSQLLEDMQAYGFQNAFAVDMGKHVGTPSPEAYFHFVTSTSDQLIPVAYLDLAEFQVKQNLDRLLSQLKEIGYRCIKIHPRLAGIGYLDPSLYEAIQKAADLNLIVFFCTFCFDTSIHILNRTIYQLNHLLNACPTAKIVLLHGGTTQVLTLSEIVRSLPPSQNVLLDLSWTICKYKGSSLNLDIGYLFKNFDRKICVGTDHPEFTHAELRERFDFFAADTPDGKLTNVGHRNLETLLWG